MDTNTAPIARTPLRIKTRSPVSARAVAIFLGVKETTVYTLLRGIRGWQKIEPLPHVADPNDAKRDRYKFFLDDVAEWRMRTGFEVKPQGRGRKRVAEKVN